jgi:hypothetical protein
MSIGAGEDAARKCMARAHACKSAAAAPRDE